MARFSTSATSTRSPEEVFSYLSDMRNAPEWDPGVSRVELVKPDEDGGVGLGAVFLVTLKVAGRSKDVEYTITRYEQPRCVVLDAVDPAFRSIDTVTITPSAGGGSVANYDAELRASGLWRVLAPLMAVGFARIGRAAAEGFARELGR